MTLPCDLSGLRALSIETFVEQQPDGVLVVNVLPVSPTARGEKRFQTGHIARQPREPGAPGQGVLVMPLSKRPGAAFSRQVTVGRTRNADVFLQDPTVSKLHAYFTRSGQGLEVSYQLVDVGSTNGTQLNARPLQRDEPAPLRDGDTVQFGDTRCVFYTPVGLHRYLRSAPTLPPLLR